MTDNSKFNHGECKVDCNCLEVAELEAGNGIEPEGVKSYLCLGGSLKEQSGWCKEVQAIDFLGKLKEQKKIELNARMNNMFVRYAMEQYSNTVLDEVIREHGSTIQKKYNLIQNKGEFHENAHCEIRTLRRAIEVLTKLKK